MSAERGLVREIVWRDVFPGLFLAKSLRIAIQPTVLALALVGCWLDPLLVRIAGFVLPSEQATADTQDGAEGKTKASAVRSAKVDATHKELSRLPGDNVSGGSIESRLIASGNPLVRFVQKTVAPFIRLFSIESSIREWFYFLLVCLSKVALWGLLGGAITRFACFELATEETLGTRQTIEFALKRWRHYLLAILYPLIGVLLLSLLGLPIGWLMLSDAGTIVSAVFFPFLILVGLLNCVIVMWMGLGWPLMAPAVSAEENGDEFEGMSRSFSYLVGKPFHYLGYLFLAILLGAIGSFFVQTFLDGAMDLSYWSASWGAGAERVLRVEELASGAGTVNGIESEKKVGQALLAGSSMISGLRRLVQSLSDAFGAALVWVTASAIYLLMRYHVDHVELDDVFDDRIRAEVTLPKATPDSRGVPQVEHSEPTSTADRHNQAE